MLSFDGTISVNTDVEDEQYSDSAIQPQETRKETFAANMTWIQILKMTGYNLKSKRKLKKNIARKTRRTP
jgi:hypothetical protein